MLKNRGGEAVTADPSSTSSLTDEKPRKKLSFRDPEVMAPKRNGPNSAPSILVRGNTSPLGRPSLARPHSVSGVVGLGGLSSTESLGGTTSMPSSPLNSSPSRHVGEGGSSHPGHGYHSSSSYQPSPLLASQRRPASPGLSKSQGSRHSGFESQRVPDRGRNVEIRQMKEDPTARQSPLKSNKKQVTYPRLHHGHSPPPHMGHSRQNSLQGHLTPPSHSSDPSIGLPNGKTRDRNSTASLEDYELENQAMKIVRTVGQAFEVCHKIATKDRSPSPDPPSHIDDLISQEGSEASSEKPKKDGLDSESGQEDLLTLPSAEDCSEALPNRPNKLEPLSPPVGSDILIKGMAGETFSSHLSDPLPAMGESIPQAGTPLSVHHELQLMREQLEQQQQQTQAAVAQVHLLRDQLAAETAARLEAQARTHQLLVHNKELLEHIQQLVLQVREMELKLYSGSASGAPAPDRGVMQVPPNPPDLKLQESLQLLQQKQQSLSAPLQTRNSCTLQQQQRQLQHIQDQQKQLQAPHVSKNPQQLQQKSRLDDCSSTPSLSSESDLRSSCQSSGENVAGSGGLSHLYNPDPRRLPQVPEDSVPLTPYGPIPLGSPRNPINSSITRAASERAPRSETLAQLQRMEWMRHTTK